MSIIIKNQQQIDGIRKSCQLAAETLRYLTPFVVEVTSTQKINELVDQFIRDHGAIPAPLNYHGYPKSVCTSINEVVCHGIPCDEQVLKNGDIINIDVTTILDGYYGDTSTMYAIGDVSPEAKDLMDATYLAMMAGIDQVKPGVQFYEIGKAITKFVKQRGYTPVYQFCGHGTGIDFHEEPQISHAHMHPLIQNETRKMKPGMIFTIEPMINQGTAEAVVDESDKWTARTKDGKLSAQYEHTILVTEEGSEILTI